MNKITLQSVSSVDNTLIAAINNNNNTLTAAMDNTISRDGTSPNQMTAVLDMNSNPIINIPFATSSNEPVALGQVTPNTTFIPALTGDVTSGSFNGSSLPTTLQPLSGDVTSSGRTVTLDTVNANIGTFQGITVNGKGLVTAATNQGYIIGNQTITLSGDVTGSGTTAITTTAASSIVKANATNTISKGYTITPNNGGTISSGTFTPDPTQGNYQFYTNNGAHTLAAPSSDCAIDILITNGASAGAITFSGFTVGTTGDVLTTTNTNKFIISIRRINLISTYIIKALQ